MERQTIQVGSFEVNCTILSEGGKAWIVDPGQEPDHLLALLTKSGLSPEAILLTHAHFDHIGAVPALCRAFPNLPVFVHPNDVPMIGHALNQMPPDYPPVAKFACRDAREFSGPTGVKVIETPGHTPGGICYLFPDFPATGSSGTQPLLLAGDTLFAGSVGRTDLPGGDMATLMNSLRQLTALPDDTLVIPGHGMFTTIAAEKRGNPFLQ